MKTCSFTKTYGSHTVLQAPAMELSPGRIYAVIGANGSGKSTLVKILSGLLASDEKQAPFKEKPLCIGHLPQKPYAFRLNTLNNVLLGAAKMDTAAAKEKALDLLTKLGIETLASKSAQRLSGGETARMALARSMMQDYDLFILDEPTASLDVQSTILAENQILSYRKETGAAILLITHSLKQARRLADEVWYLQNGQIIETGTSEQVLYSPADARTRQFLEFYSL